MRPKSVKPLPLYNGNPQIALLLRILMATFILSIARLMLYIFNPGLFPDHSILSILRLYIAGLRFDLSTALYANAILIVLFLIPFRWRSSKGYQQFTGFLFCLINIILVVPSLIDVIYYRFTMKRLTGDIFTYLGVGMESNLVLQFFIDFWYILLIWIFLIILLIGFSRRIRISPKVRILNNFSYYSGQLLLAALFGGLAVLGMRGGFQLKPINIISASAYAEAQDIPLVLNSSFTIMKTIDQKGLEKKTFFSNNKELLKYFNAEQCYQKNDSIGKPLPMTKKNVIIIILESFSQEHIGFYNKQLLGLKTPGYTPFLDSLISVSTSFNGFANGKRSIEGIPSILSSLPTWMTQDYITSQYAANKTNSLASLLRQEGYCSAFFHGGSNGTMGFDTYAGSSGFDKYFGRTEYNNDKDFDGQWGIWDEPYLQYCAGEISQLKQPFLSAIFTLSSHHPYKIPAKYEDRFSKNASPVQRTILYTDYALQLFFKTVSGMPWFSNTLFVITADHTSEATAPVYKTSVGAHRIPIVFYTPGDSLYAANNVVMQQADIMPSVLDYLNYPGKFISFGSSVFDQSKERFSLSFTGNTYQLIRNNYALLWSENEKKQLYDYIADPMLKKPLAPNSVKEYDKTEHILKSVIQQYNSRMIENRLSIQQP
jgi:phosphoglycerol transferase MdoB-like AlkP superfamily enzyme